MQDWTGIVEAARVAGWIIYPLSLLALVALFIILDRLYVFWRFSRVPDIASYGGDDRGYTDYPALDT